LCFRPGELWLDEGGLAINAHGGGILYHLGTYYWFGEHKIAGEAGNRAHVGVHVYTSKDLYGWKDAGIALRVDPQGGELLPDCIIERPKVIYNSRTKQFVMWFHFEPVGARYTGSRSGVAVADAPTGPYRFLRSLRPNAGIWPENTGPAERVPLTAEEEARLNALDLPGGPRPWYPKHGLFRRDFAGGQMARDMTLFVDDDGAAYHVYASEANGTLQISLLTDDYLAPVGRYVRVMPGRFHEAPALMKAHGRYFLMTSDCTGWSPNAARLSVADSIWGPWEEVGNPCLGPGSQLANTFESQPTFILKVADRENAFIFMADRWRPKNAIDGRYVWLPIEFRFGFPTISWRDTWDLGVFR